MARELKYRSHETDFGALAKELHGEKDGSEPAGSPPDDVGDDDEWSAYAADRERD
ncbi:DUF3073 family protein [Nocardioides sp.]|uniref:DUF3073 family protein n=1 Tax=Nocardioides sp. TaxID=35761 RepID=UPI0039C958B6